MKVTKDIFPGVYQQGLNEGFGIVDARQYYVRDAFMRPELEQMVATPWIIGNDPVFGYAVTDIDIEHERLYGCHKTLAHEFWIFDARQGMPVNLAQLYPQGYQLSDRSGQMVALNDAFAVLDDFASAASFLPHVFMAEEFAEARNYLHGRMGLPPVTAADYRAYLEHIETQLQNEDLTFVGKIRKVSDLHIAYESIEGSDF